ncbi:hypothetical protein [Zobellella taiwanensis]|uniref:hypothetical protein n=1 Tax=Zobellella taiwanensis TaxID=347535 RepID=UPI0011B207E6|nr:hypothetical protein [Zobellella taiwanensis]
MSKNQSAYMLESAEHYLRAAKIIWNQPNLNRVAIVNAAIGIEIILKSFLATPVDNNRKGTISEQYEIKGRKIHGLLELLSAIDPSLSQKLKFDHHKEWLERHNNIFIEDRYPYEPTSNPAYSQTLIHIGIEMFRSTISWYKSSGNKDPWIIAYPDVPGGGL